MKVITLLEYKRIFLDCYLDICEKANWPKILPGISVLDRGILMYTDPPYFSTVTGSKIIDTTINDTRYRIYGFHIQYEIYSEKCSFYDQITIIGDDGYQRVYYTNSNNFSEIIDTIINALQQMRNTDRCSSNKRTAADCENLITAPAKWPRKNIIEQTFEKECRKRNVNYYVDISASKRSRVSCH